MVSILHKILFPANCIQFEKQMRGSWSSDQLAFYSDDPSSNPAEAYKMLFEMKEAGLAHWKNKMK